MSATEKIKHYTGRNPKEVREWAFVYWVNFGLGRPTLISKKLVDRASELQVIAKSSVDAIVRDHQTGNAYAVRCDWVGQGFVKEIQKGTRINLNSFDYSALPGSGALVYHLKPCRVSELIAKVVSVA